MSGTGPFPGADEAPDRDVDRVCNRFEAAWRAGHAPRIEDFLAETPAAARLGAARELIALDVFYRRRQGHRPRPEDYLGRFADLDPGALAESMWDDAAGDSRAVAPPTPTFDHALGDTLPAAAPPRLVGDYEIRGEIARGGMGVVYRARQLSLNRLVALKMILPGQLVSAEASQRFRAEAENVARLQHEHIVPIYEVGDYQGQPYFSMKLIESGSLDRRMAEFNNDPPATARLMATIARAVHHAHQHGLIHRDLKPSNILVDPHGQPHVTDFGLAKRLEASIDLTRSNAIVGTPCYMAPEQAAGRQQNVSTVTDVYGLGAVLYEMLTGRPPFKADSPLDTLAQVLQDEPVRPQVRRREVPRDLEVICLKCLQKEPESRYPSAIAVAEDLERWLTGTPITARPATWWERTVKWARRRPAVAALAGVSGIAILAVVGLVVGLFYSERLARSNRELEETQGELRDAKDEADRQRARATEEEKRAKRFLYASQIVLAQQAVDKGRLGDAYQMLDTLRPEKVDDFDARGPEWYHLWRKCNGDKMALPGKGVRVTALAMDAGAERIAVARADGSLLIWSILDQGLTQLVSSDSFPFAELEFHGEIIVAANLAGDVRAWDSRTGTSVKWAERAPLLPVAERLAERARQRLDVKILGVWTRTIEEPIPSLTVSSLMALCGSPASPAFIAVTGADVSLVKRRAERERLQALRHVRNDVGETPSKRVRVYGTINKNASPSADVYWLVQMTERGAMAPITLDPRLPTPITAVTVRNDGLFGAVGFGNRSIRLYDLQKRVSIKELPTASLPSVLLLNADGAYLIAGGVDGGVRIWAVDIGPQPAAKGKTLEINNLVLRADGRQVAGDMGHVRTWDVASATPAWTRPSPAGRRRHYRRVAYSSDGKWVTDGTRVFDADTGRESQVCQAIVAGSDDDDIYDAAFSPDGRWIAAAASSGITMWDVQTGMARHRFQLARNWGMSVAFSPDGRLLAGGGAEMGPGSLKIWNVETGEEQLSIDQPDLSVWGVAFSPDGTLLAAGRGVYRYPKPLIGDVKVWRVDTGREVAAFPANSPCVWRVAFSPDGRRLAAACGPWQGIVETPPAVKVWDLESKLEILSLPGDGQPFRGVGFSPDGRTVVTGRSDGLIQFRGKHSQAWMARYVQP